MPLISDYQQVMDIYQEAAELGIGLPVFCTEDRETLEAILASAFEYGQKIGRNDIPIIPAWTSRYPGRSQMALVSACGDPVLGSNLMFSDLEAFMGETSPYRNLRVMPHLDHALPWLDGDILMNSADKFASVMCDASEKPFEENMRITAEYVDRINKRVVVEGAVDEIIEYGNNGAKNEPTTADQAERFLRETGVDIIVPNVGTEHRATADKVEYLSDKAREISSRVGKILCLHGTSSVKPEDLTRLADDGFVKINIFTTLAVYGGQAIARKVLANLGNIFGEAEIKELIDQKILGEAVLSSGYGETQMPIKPKLNFVCNPTRRDAWFEAVKNRCGGFYEVFGYRRYAK